MVRPFGLEAGSFFLLEFVSSDKIALVKEFECAIEGSGRNGGLNFLHARKKCGSVRVICGVEDNLGDEESLFCDAQTLVTTLLLEVFELGVGGHG